MIAHRGGADRHPENTLEALVGAHALGADMVETDCRLTSDGVVVAVHDHDLKRIWGDRRAVGDVPWAVLSTLRRGPYRVPSLAEVLRTVDVPVMVDLPRPEAAAACLVVVEAEGALGRCVFAGHLGALRQARQLRPAARIALSWERRELPLPELLQDLRPEYFNPHWRLVTPALVRWAHAQGMLVSAWTVNQAWSMRQARRAQVDAVITDRVSRMVAACRRPGAERGAVYDAERKPGA